MPVVDLPVPVCEGSLVEREGNFPALPGLQGDLLKALQFLNWTTDCSYNIADVKLYHFISGTVTSVFNGY